MQPLIPLIITAALLLLATSTLAAPEGFRLHGRFLGIGACLKTIVGPGPEPGSERVYGTHVYSPQVFDVVAVDPATGQSVVFESAVPGETGAWAMVLGPDGQVYVGSLSRAHIQRVDWAQRKLVDMGRPSDTEQYIWQLAVGSDKKLYGCTYPQAKLVRFDPATGRGEDLGRMDDHELYARSVAADDKGFVYIGIGTEKMHLVAYEIATGEHRDILPPELVKPGFGSVHRGADGVVYGTAGAATFRLEGWTATPIKPEERNAEAPPTLADGRTAAYDGKTLKLTPPGGATQILQTGYVGKEQGVFRIGAGPDGLLYGSTAMPIHLFWADPNSEDWEEVALAGSGEFYSFLAWDGKLIGAAYGGDAPVMLYDPAKPWAPATTAEGNPWLIHYEGENSGWRPQALIAGPLERAYIGAVSGYGALGGPLCVYDPKTGTVDQYRHVVQDQSVVALAALPEGTIVGGTTIGGGGGSHPTTTEAKLFLWDPATRQKTFETVPVPAVATISALAVGPDGLVYGFAEQTLFVFDPARREVISTKGHALGGVVYNAVGPGPDGELYGLTSKGVFRVNRETKEPELLAAYPEGITGGFAIIGDRVYFTSHAQIVSYGLR